LFLIVFDFDLKDIIFQNKEARENGFRYFSVVVCTFVVDGSACFVLFFAANKATRDVS
jgi:hypothetical protein